MIWQTVTKPVSASSYVLGKWLGVVSLAVLIAVTGAPFSCSPNTSAPQPGGG